MDNMDFPEIMTSGFNFDEAITMAELCRRVYKVFENQYIKKPKELYDALHEDDEWEFIHSISDYKTDGRALILKRKDRNQFAVVFRGTIFTSGGFEFTGQQGNEDIRLAEYEPIPDEPTPPSNNIRVYAGLMNGFEALRDELELFFDLLLGSKLKSKQIVDLIDAGEEEKQSMIDVIDAVILFKLNENITYRFMKKFNLFEKTTVTFDDFDPVDYSLKEYKKDLFKKINEYDEIVMKKYIFNKHILELIKYLNNIDLNIIIFYEKIFTKVVSKVNKEEKKKR